MNKKIIYSKNQNIKLPYILVLPEDYNNDASLIVELSTPYPSLDPLEVQIENLVNENSGNSLDYNLKLLMDKLKYPALIPIIPRPEGFYTTYLGSKVINNDFSNTKLTSEEKEILTDIPKQVKEMIIEANNTLGLTNKVIIKGYSATAKFATGFSILYPELIKMNISGGTGGLSTIPAKTYEGLDLIYPIGVSDIENFNIEAYKNIKHFFFIGDRDNNNPALPKCIMSDEEDVNGNKLPLKNENGQIEYVKDVDGLLLPTYDECYTKLQTNLIHELYGDENLSRFLKNEKIYKSLGVNSMHKVYPGNHNSVLSQNREEIINEIIDFLNIK